MLKTIDGRGRLYCDRTDLPKYCCAHCVNPEGYKRSIAAERALLERIVEAGRNRLLNVRKVVLRKPNTCDECLGPIPKGDPAKRVGLAYFHLDCEEK